MQGVGEGQIQVKTLDDGTDDDRKKLVNLLSDAPAHSTVNILVSE